MIRTGLLLLLCLAPGLSSALDIENAKKINKSCALCHGVYGQGTPGTLSPRLAGLPEEYLAKELKYYRDGVRNYPPMVVASSIAGMTDEDIDDISEYLAGVNLRNLNLPEIPEYPNGKEDEGREVFLDECKSCHRRSGLGKPKKGIPPVAGQYGSYLFGQMKKFQAKDRHHDDDPDDDTFDDFEDAELDNLIAFLTKLPPHGPLEKIEPFAVTMGGMASMGDMSGMIAMTSDGTLSSMQGMSGGAGGGTKIAGRFRITPTGDILLSPTNQDMRPVAGLSGDFKVTPDGILFIPK
ncbi:MAG: c-type cytochrome [Pseudomonadota bacterium]|nr:c-type cytochrome [Pseudomonadota bacterium]